MNTLAMTKSDIRFFLVAFASLPILGFVIGFYTASGLLTSHLSARKTIETPITLQSQTITEPIESLMLLTEPEGAQVKINGEPIKTQQQLTGIEKPQVYEPMPVEKVSVLPIEKVAKKMPASNSTYYAVQAGVFSKYRNAARFQSQLQNKSIETFIIDTSNKGRRVYRIIVDSFLSHDAAMQLLNAMKEKHRLDLYITRIRESNYLKTVAAL